MGNTYDQSGNLKIVTADTEIGCRVYTKTFLNVSNNSSVVVTWDSNDYDPSGMHSTSSNTSRITFPVAGRYWVWCNMTWDGDGQGGRWMYFRINGSAGPYYGVVNNCPTTNIQYLPNPSSIYGHSVFSGFEYNAAAGDYVEVVAGIYNAGGSASCCVNNNDKGSPSWGARLV